MIWSAVLSAILLTSPDAGISVVPGEGPEALTLAPADPDGGPSPGPAAADAGEVELAADAGPASPDGVAAAVDGGDFAGSSDAGAAAEPRSNPSDAAPPPSSSLSLPPDLSWAAPTTFRLYGNLTSRLGIAPEFLSTPGDPNGQNVADLRSWVTLGAEATLGDSWKAVVEGRLRHRAVEQRPPPGQPFLLLNGERAKATAEVFVGDAYLDHYSRWVDLRVGNQIIPMGANAQGAAADVLNPLDIREGVFFNDPADVKLDVPAIKASGELAGFDWMVALVPFFVPDKLDLVGQNEGFYQPGIGAPIPLPTQDPSVEDSRQQSILVTQLPRAVPQDGDLGLRVTRKLPGDITVGLDYALTREKLPAVTVDPELSRFLKEGPNAPFTDPATALSLSQRYGAGQQLLVGDYPRFQVGEAEASGLFGPVQVDADLGYSPSRLYVDTNFNPVYYPTATGTLTVADARGTRLTLAATAQVLYVLNIPQGTQVMFVDLPGAQQEAHDTFGAGLVGLVGYRFFEDRLELEGRIFFDARQGDRAIGGHATWAFSDHIHGTVGAQFFNGPLDSPFGYWRLDDQIYGQIRLDL